MGGALRHLGGMLHAKSTTSKLYEITEVYWVEQTRRAEAE